MTLSSDKMTQPNLNYNIEESSMSDYLSNQIVCVVSLNFTDVREINLFVLYKTFPNEWYCLTIVVTVLKSSKQN